MFTYLVQQLLPSCPTKDVPALVTETDVQSLSVHLHPTKKEKNQSNQTLSRTLQEFFFKTF